MKVVLDTSALIHWAFNPERLSATAAALIARSSELLISSISLWEIGLKHRHGKLHLPLEPKALALQIEGTENARIVSVDWATWLESVRLKWEHRDPADRCIVALARMHNCDLVTSDEEIRRFYPQAIW